MKGNKIIDATSISQKTKRMAFQIYEDNFDQETIYVLGIKPAGYLFAKRLADMLSSISPIKVVLIAVDINKQNPLSSAENPFDNTIDLTDKNVLLVDDVANTGKTLYFALKPILHFLPKKVQTAWTPTITSRPVSTCPDA